MAKKKLLALTPAGPAASANPQCRGALPADTGGLQHGLHVLVLRSVLGVLQALGLALRGGRGAGELAGLREERGFVVLTKKASVETASCKGGSLPKSLSLRMGLGVQIVPKERNNSDSSPRAHTTSQNTPQQQQGMDKIRGKMDALAQTL